MAKNWDIAIVSSALLLIVGGLAAPHVRRLLAVDADVTDRTRGVVLPG